jgi:hypothetical protein
LISFRTGRNLSGGHEAAARFLDGFVGVLRIGLSADTNKNKEVLSAK